MSRSRSARVRATRRPCRREPGHLGPLPPLEGSDRDLVAKGERDLVLTRQQHLLAERIDLEPVAHAVRAGDRLRLEVQRDRGPGPLVELPAEGGDTRRGQQDRQQPVLDAVLVEDVAEARRDHRADAPGVERPHRHLARRAAAEVLGRHEDLRAAVGGLVQDELGLLRAVGVEAHVVEQEARVVRRVPGLAQEARGDDAVGIDVRQVDRRGDRVDAGEGLQLSPPASGRR